MRRAILAVGILLLAISALWRPLAVPQLVKFPSHVDETTHYRGTFVVHVDPATHQPLADPVTLPLEIDRRVRSLPGGGAHTAVLEEAVTYRIEGTTQRERHRYVIDRRSMENRDDGRSWSFSPENRIHPAGTYRVTLPLGTTAGGRYRIWENEPGRSFAMVRDPARAEARRHGLALIGLQEVWHGAPVARYYRAELRKQGFALELTFPQLAARLAEGGVDVDQALAALAPTDAPIAAAVVELRLPLRFFRDNDGHALVEPRTGAIVELVSSEEAITAVPDLAPLDELRGALARAPASAEVTALADALDAIEREGPTPVYTLRYEQTADSVADAARRTKDDLRSLDLVERTIPRTLAVVAAALLVVVGLGHWRDRLRRRRSGARRAAVERARATDRRVATGPTPTRSTVSAGSAGCRSSPAGTPAASTSPSPASRNH